MAATDVDFHITVLIHSLSTGRMNKVIHAQIELPYLCHIPTIAGGEKTKSTSPRPIKATRGTA
jgi:hypothetical protein